MNLRSAAAALAALLLPLPAAAIDEFPTFADNCYNFEIGDVSLPSPVRMIHESVFLGLNVRQTGRFQQCIRNSGFRACRGDLSTDVEDGVRVASTTNHLEINCRTNRNGALGEAFVGNQLLHNRTEYISLSTDALLPGFHSSGIWRMVLASVIWHEVAHTHGYNHELFSPFCRDTPGGAGRPSMNEIIGECMMEAAKGMVSDQVDRRITDPASHRPFTEELESLLKSLTVSKGAEASVSRAVEDWLEGPDLRIRTAGGSYLMHWSSCSPGSVCFAGLDEEAALEQSPAWHILPESTSPDSPATRPGLHVRLLNVDEGKCLSFLSPQIPGVSPVGLGRCLGEDVEKWTIGPTTLNPDELDSGRFKIHPWNDHTVCLAADSEGGISLTNDCAEPGTDLAFEYLTGGGQGFTVRTARGDRCLDVPSGSDSPGTALQVYPCHGGPNQVWRLRETGALTFSVGARAKEYFLQNDASQLCVRVDGSAVTQVSCVPPCDPGDPLCLGRTSQATPFAMRGHGSVFLGGYGWLTGYGNAFVLKTLKTGNCLTQFYTGSSLSSRACGSVESDPLYSQRWRFFRAR
jgi:hypothetical protein